MMEITEGATQIRLSTKILPAIIALLVMAGCVALPRLPEQTSTGQLSQGDAANPNPCGGPFSIGAGGTLQYGGSGSDKQVSTVEQALSYAYCTQIGYDEYLRRERSGDVATGLLEVGLAGAGVGLGAAGVKGPAVAAVAAAAAATVAGDQWVFGSSSKDPRYKAYTDGISRLQCVIDAARAAVPSSSSLRSPPASSAPASAVREIRANLAVKVGISVSADSKKAPAPDKSESDFSSSYDALEQTLTSGGGCLTETTNPDTSAALLETARAEVVRRRAEAVTNVLDNLPSAIVEAVRHIHWQETALIESNPPDITTINVGSKSTMSSTPAAAQTETRSSMLTEMKPHALTQSSPCRSAAADMANETAKIKAALSGVSIAPVSTKGGEFANCLASTTTTGNTGGMSTPGGQGMTKPSGTAAEALSVLPSTEINTEVNQSATLSISGGDMPSSIAIDPDVRIANITTGSGGAIKESVSLVNKAPSGRVLVYDMAGAEVIVTLTAVEPVKE